MEFNRRRKRERYQTDPAWRQNMLDAQRRSKQKQQAAKAAAQLGRIAEQLEDRL
jgi:hypothetical protein